MTEHSVKRVMIGATIAAATALTALAIGGLVVTSRGPQAQELPLVRTSIVQVAILDPSGGGDHMDSTADHPPVTQPPAQQGDDQNPPVSSVVQTTTTTAVVSAPGGGAAVSSGTTARSTSDSFSTEQAGTTTRSFPPLSLPPLSLTPSSIVTLSSAPSAPTSDSKDGAASATRSEETKKSGSGERDHDREVVSPRIRESDDEHHG